MYGTRSRSWTCLSVKDISAHRVGMYIVCKPATANVCTLAVFASINESDMGLVHLLIVN